MTKNIYSIRDNLAEEFGPLFEAKNHLVAKRARQKLMDENPQLNISEFSLWYIGTINDKAEITDCNPRELTAKDFALGSEEEGV